MTNPKTAHEQMSKTKKGHNRGNPTPLAVVCAAGKYLATYCMGLTTWTSDINQAWKVDPQSIIAAKIAARFGGSVIPITAARAQK